MKFDPAIVQVRYPSPLGLMTLAATPVGLAGVWFDGQQHMPPALAHPGSWPVDAAHPVLVNTARQLDEYFAGQRLAFDLTLDLRGGTAFQRAVWQALLALPYGQTSSYGSISRNIGHAAAVRAVGAAVGRNPLSLVVPCHRVLGSGGLLTGYAGGLERKTALLRLEGALEENLP